MSYSYHVTLRSLRLSNANLQKRLCSLPGGLELLLAAGFTVETETTPRASTSNEGVVGDSTGASDTKELLSSESFLRHRCHVFPQHLLLLKTCAER